MNRVLIRLLVYAELSVYSLLWYALTISILLVNSVEDKLETLSYFTDKTGFDISCKMTSLTTSKKFQTLAVFWRQNRKIFKHVLAAENFTQHVMR